MELNRVVEKLEGEVEVLEGTLVEVIVEKVRLLQDIEQFLKSNGINPVDFYEFRNERKIDEAIEKQNS